VTDGLTALVAGAGAGDRGAVARLVTVLERGGPPASEVAGLLPSATPATQIVGVTGAPGAGKSTLIGRMLEVLVADGRRPAVLAVDPSSSLTGGAVLGDRVRLQDGAASSAYVRSMATRGQQGGLAAAVPSTLRLLAHAGFDPVIIETTGVGQAEVDIAGEADTTVLVTAPGWGDGIQAIKAGLLELADVLVVNKADLPGAADVRRELDGMLDLGRISGLADRVGSPRAAVVMTDARQGRGADALIDAVDAHRAWLESSGHGASHRARRAEIEASALVTARVRDAVDRVLSGPAGRGIVGGLADGSVTPATAADRILTALPGVLHGA
jgi:LAO/AO transport system kinase